MNFISVKKCKINYSRFKIKTLNLIKFSKTVSIFWKEFQSRIQEKVQKVKDTICRCKNILFSKICRIKDKVIFKGKNNQYIKELKKENLKIKRFELLVRLLKSGQTCMNGGGLL